MQSHVSTPNAPSLIDLGKKRAKREAVPSSGRLPSGPLIDLGKKDVPRRAVRQVSPASPNRVVRVTLVWLGLAVFGVMLWAFYAARNSVPAPAVAAPRANKAFASPVKTADETPQLGTFAELSQGAELPSSVLKASSAEIAEPFPMPKDKVKYEEN